MERAESPSAMRRLPVPANDASDLWVRANIGKRRSIPRNTAAQRRVRRRQADARDRDGRSLRAPGIFAEALPVRATAGGFRSAARNDRGELESRAETFAARTARRRIRILYFESALQFVGVIQFAARNVQRALGIDHHTHAAGLDQEIAVRRAVLQVHFVLQPGTTAADDRHAQHAIRPALLA